MDTLERTRSPVRRQVEAYEESWKNDHDTLKVSWALEDTISIGLATFLVLKRAENSWRDRVFSGGEQYSEEANRFFIRQHEIWLFTTEHVLALAVELEQRGGAVEGADQLREQAEQAKQRLATWSSPRLSAAVGLREMSVPKEAADELNRILTEARSSPPKPITSTTTGQSPADLLARRSRR
jgi:hypothetical protein